MSTITKLPSGKFRVQVRKRGVYKSETFTKKSDAVRWGTEAESLIESGSLAGYQAIPKAATVADLIEKYTATSKATGKTKLATLKMLQRELGRLPLAGFSRVHLRDFIDRRVRQGAGGVTISVDLSYLTTVFKWGRFTRMLDLNVEVVKDAKAGLQSRGLKTRSNERDREPTDDELAKLYAHWSENPRQQIPMETICRFALASSMRLGEICSLRTADIDVDRKTVIIRNRKDPKNKQGNDQLVPLLPDAFKIAKHRIKLDPDAEYIFPYAPSSVSTAFTRGCKAVGIVDLHFHDLRHRATAELFRRGLDIPEVAVLTGHKTWMMLRRYTKISPEDVFAKFKAQK